ncbi:MAG TPA: low affinity iron permease family protein, partial [Chloroflexia bacterium]|nr:low affinity iron permease family protein [Chloroflexia bacterium]
LIRAAKGARNDMIDLEDLSDDEMKELQVEFQRICTRRHENSHNKSQSEGHTTPSRNVAA